MRLLKKTLIAVGILVLLKVILILLDKYSPHSILFHRNLITSLQLFCFGWLVLGLIMGLIFRHDPRRANRVTWIVLLVMVAVLEGLFFYWMRNPSKIPSSLFASFKEYYIHHHRNIVQVERNCSEYDSAFFYRLRANNSCVFSNIEFSNTIQTNSRGLRDDEASLAQPNIICIGDSYTMGWGVQQDETYPARLEKLTGQKVLNAGMSSFGTIRELRQFAQLDTSNCRWVVLQYCDNDMQEVKPYLDSGYRLQTSNAAAYDTLVRRSEWNHGYYPGKTFFTVGMFRIKESIKKFTRKGTPEYAVQLGAGQQVTMPESAKLFAETLRQSAPLFTNRSLIVLYAFEGGRKDTVFTRHLQQLLATSPYKEAFTNPVYIVNASTLLTTNDNYLLDDHYRASGHEKIAAAIAAIIRGR
ncbi:MAG TPA: hypothetical protein VD993_01410 [Chitinophagaceae bacterium]|nr:hypothetical protein [Chitinophagaceae bacterium]